MTKKPMRAFQFTLAGAMGVFTVVVICMFSDQKWLIALTASMATVYLTAHLATRNLPSAIATMMQANVIRLDGSLSTRRSLIEKKAANRLKVDLFVVLLIVFFPTAFLLWFANAELIPLSIGVDVIREVDLFQDDLRPGLKDQEVAFDNWKKNTSSSIDPETHKRLLWNFWPLITIFATVWLAGCCFFVRSGYFYLLKNLQRDVRERAQQYQLVDCRHYLDHSASIESDVCEAKEFSRRANP